MMLVHKPQAFTLAQPSSLNTFHRRHPSAPPQVVVQPTRTPGLLNIARPTKTQSPQRQLPATQRKGQAATTTAQKEKKQVARAPPALLNPAEITQKRPAVVAIQGPASPTPVRGRVAPKQGKERRNKQHGRQPSPPVVEDASSASSSTSPSQAEVLVPSHNQFDPFTDIAAPKPHHPPQQHLSTSAPTRSTVRPRSKKAHSSDRFPVCDDMTDAGDLSEAETPPPQTPPATPLRKQAANPKGPSGSAGFPFMYPTPSPQQQRKGGRKHRRSPSEGVFNMSLSSDEDVASAPPSSTANPLLSFARSRAQTRPPVTPPTSLSKVTAGAFALGLDKVPAPFFASSKFQNSPSPEDLPTDEPAWE